jgi:hypothetical protein
MDEAEVQSDSENGGKIFEGGVLTGQKTKPRPEHLLWEQHS